MIRQYINIDDYWEVIVYYNIDYNFFDDIVIDLKAASTPVEEIYKIYYNLLYNAKACTYSNLKEKVSIVLFNIHEDKYDYINSIVHEAEHIKQHMLKAYKIDDEGEPPAYTIGYITMQMLKINTKLRLL